MDIYVKFLWGVCNEVFEVFQVFRGFLIVENESYYMKFRLGTNFWDIWISAQ